MEIIEIENRQHAQELGNLSYTFRNQLRRAIGKHTDIVFSGDCGTVKDRFGKCYDWFMKDGNLSIHAAN